MIIFGKYQLDLGNVTQEIKILIAPANYQKMFVICITDGRHFGEVKLGVKVN